jgi:hypothetical protein
VPSDARTAVIPSSTAVSGVWEFQRSDLDTKLEALVLGEEVGKVFLDGWTSTEHALGRIDVTLHEIRRPVKTWGSGGDIRRY